MFCSLIADAINTGNRRSWGLMGSDNYDANSNPVDWQWTPSAPARRTFESSASVVLIGLPGTGKRSLGFIASTHLRRRLCTDNGYFEASTGLSKAAFLKEHGRQALLTRSLRVLQQMLDNNSVDCIIECGVTSLSPAARDMLVVYAQTHPIIHLLRDAEDTPTSLQRSSTIDIAQWLHADACHRSCSNFEFHNLYDSSTVANGSTQLDEHVDHASSHSSPVVLQHVKLDFCKFLDSILGRARQEPAEPFYNSRVHIVQKHRSFVTTWQLSDLLATSLPDSSTVEGLDAIEVRIDRWQVGMESIVSKYIARIRRHHSVSIICSASITTQLMPQEYLLAITHSLRLGVDCIAIDGFTPEDMQQWMLASKGHALAMADFTYNDNPTPRAWQQPDRLAHYMASHRIGYDIVRQTQLATTQIDNDDLWYFRKGIERTLENGIPLVAYNNGVLGRPSKVYNKILTDVQSGWNTNSDADSLSAKTCVTMSEITRALFASFIYHPLEFFVFCSSPMDFSLSPAMYRAAFQRYGLWHEMRYQQSECLTDLLGWALRREFGGAAITFPFKEAMFEACSELSGHATAIGSVNSIVPLREAPGCEKSDLKAQVSLRNTLGRVVGFYGDNTDWIGFYRTVRRHLTPRNAAADARETAVVFGAGGSARAAIYAMIQLDYKNIYIRNRTEEKAHLLAKHFNAWLETKQQHNISVKVMPTSQDYWPSDVPLPTVMIACVPTDGDFHIPCGWLDSPTGGVTAEISYQQGRSKLQEQVRARTKPGARPWSIVDPRDLLLESKISQFEFLTGYRGPRNEMARLLHESGV